MSFENKVAISTGAASGMGLLFAQEWVKQGGNVALCDVNEEVLSEQVAQINALGPGKAIGLTCDVRDYNRICQVRDEVVNTFGRIDVLANFAGGYALRMLKVDTQAYPEFPDVPIEVFDWGLDVNLKGPFYFSHAVMKQMREQKSGVIVNIGSISGAEGDGHGIEYPTAKAALMYGFTKSLAKCGAPHNVRCVCVSPGPVLTRAAMANMKTMLGRAAQPQEIIDLVMYLVSDKASFITGENIMIDGGRNAMGRA